MSWFLRRGFSTQERASHAVARSVPTAEVLAVLREIEAFFGRHRVRYLAVIDERRRAVERIQASVLPEGTRMELLRLFGGMGSLNDVIVSRLNGDEVEDEEKANEELDRMTHRLWTLLSGLER